MISYTIHKNKRDGPIAFIILEAQNKEEAVRISNLHSWIKNKKVVTKVDISEMAFSQPLKKKTKNLDGDTVSLKIKPLERSEYDAFAKKVLVSRKITSYGKRTFKHGAIKIEEYRSFIQKSVEWFRSFFIALLYE